MAIRIVSNVLFTGVKQIGNMMHYFGKHINNIYNFIQIKRKDAITYNKSLNAFNDVYEISNDYNISLKLFFLLAGYTPWISIDKKNFDKEVFNKIVKYIEEQEIRPASNIQKKKKGFIEWFSKTGNLFIKEGGMEVIRGKYYFVANDYETGNYEKYPLVEPQSCSLEHGLYERGRLVNIYAIVGERPLFSFYCPDPGASRGNWTNSIKEVLLDESGNPNNIHYPGTVIEDTRKILISLDAILQNGFLNIKTELNKNKIVSPSIESIQIEINKPGSNSYLPLDIFGARENVEYERKGMMFFMNEFYPLFLDKIYDFSGSKSHIYKQNIDSILLNRKLSIFYKKLILELMVYNPLIKDSLTLGDEEGNAILNDSIDKISRISFNIFLNMKNIIDTLNKRPI